MTSPLSWRRSPPVDCSLIPRAASGSAIVIGDKAAPFLIGLRFPTANRWPAMADLPPPAGIRPNVALGYNLINNACLSTRA
jgi:hypothetical protein